MALTTLTGSDELLNFYRSKFYFSYSGLNKLLFSPRMFYSHYILNQREDTKDAHLVAGSVLHCLLFEPHKFDDAFIVSLGKLPSDNNRKILDALFRLHEQSGNGNLSLGNYQTEMLALLAQANLHQSLKTDQQRLDKMMSMDHINYFEFLKGSVGKSVLDQETLTSCQASIEVLKANENVRALLQLDRDITDTSIEVYNELLISADVKSLPFGFKGILDNVVIDKNTKTLFINDLKTTGKNIESFPESVQFYKYWMQAVIYKKLAYYKFINSLPDSKDWKIVITFIVIDKYNQVYPFQVSEESLAIWEKDFSNIVTIAKYHYENRDYNLPYELALGNVKL